MTTTAHRVGLALSFGAVVAAATLDYMRTVMCGSTNPQYVVGASGPSPLGPVALRRHNQGMEAAPISVLVADDDADLRLLVRVVLEQAGFDVVEEAIDGEEALAALARLEHPPIPTVMVLDNLMPGLSGLEVAERVLADVPDQRVILFSPGSRRHNNCAQIASTRALRCLARGSSTTATPPRLASLRIRR